MPQSKKDVLTLLAATEEMATDYADRPIITCQWPDLEVSAVLRVKLLVPVLHLVPAHRLLPLDRSNPKNCIRHCRLYTTHYNPYNTAYEYTTGLFLEIHRTASGIFFIFMQERGPMDIPTGPHFMFIIYVLLCFIILPYS